jgi:hypothetical protein
LARLVYRETAKQYRRNGIWHVSPELSGGRVNCDDARRQRIICNDIAAAAGDECPRRPSCVVSQRTLSKPQVEAFGTGVEGFDLMIR